MSSFSQRSRTHRPLPESVDWSRRLQFYVVFRILFVFIYSSPIREIQEARVSSRPSVARLIVSLVICTRTRDTRVMCTKGGTLGTGPMQTSVGWFNKIHEHEGAAGVHEIGSVTSRVRLRRRNIRRNKTTRAPGCTISSVVILSLGFRGNGSPAS